MAFRGNSIARVWLAVMAALGGVHCRPAVDHARVVAGYDAFTSRLIQLSADLNGDGRFDQWTYMEGNRPLRGEADVNADGRVDRWEYFDGQATLVLVGTSSQNDGVEDTWTSPESSNGESQVARSRHRDRTIDRREVITQGVLVRAEEDTNSDGRPDKWEIYDAGVLREAMFDMSLSRGRADRRLVFDARGELAVIEQDDDGDGRFEPLAAAEQDALREKLPRSSKR